MVSLLSGLRLIDILRLEDKERIKPLKMERITFFFTCDPNEAKMWDLNFKFIANDGGIFYTARLFFRDSKYFQTLFASKFKENHDNAIYLDISSSLLNKYLLLLKEGRRYLELTLEEMVTLIEIADQQEMKPVIQRLITPLLEAEIIRAEDFFRLIKAYHLDVKAEVHNLIRLEGFADYINELDEDIFWDCFRQACHELQLFAHCQVESPIALREYKRIIRACYQRFPDKAEKFREEAAFFLNNSYQPTQESLRKAGLFSKELIFDFQPILEQCLACFED